MWCREIYGNLKLVLGKYMTKWEETEFERDRDKEDKGRRLGEEKET